MGQLGLARGRRGVEVLDAVAAVCVHGSHAVNTGSAETMAARVHSDDGLELEGRADALRAQGVLIGRGQIFQEKRLEHSEAARPSQALWILGRRVQAGTAQGVAAKAISPALVADVADVPATVRVRAHRYDERTGGT